MKFAIFGFVFLVSIAATCALYGWLESSMNMIEGLRQFFRPGAVAPGAERGVPYIFASGHISVRIVVRVRRHCCFLFSATLNHLSRHFVASQL
jgi:hypothetical protein